MKFTRKDFFQTDRERDRAFAKSASIFAEEDCPLTRAGRPIISVVAHCSIMAKAFRDMSRSKPTNGIAFLDLVSVFCSSRCVHALFDRAKGFASPLLFLLRDVSPLLFLSARSVLFRLVQRGHCVLFVTRNLLVALIASRESQ